MNGDKLIVFRWNKKLGFLLIIPLILGILLLFLIYGFLIFYILKINSSWIIGISFFIFMYGSSFALNIWISPLIFKEIGWIYNHAEELILDINSLRTSYNIEQIRSLEFYYLGDWEWKAKNERFQKWKTRSRYYKRKNEFNFEGKERFDKIVLNDKKLYVKIRNENEKDQFFRILNWAKDHEIKFKLWETK